MVGMLIFVLDIKKSFSFRILNLSSITLSFFQAYYVLTAKDVKHLKKTQARIEPETPIESDVLDVEQQDPSRKPRRRKYPKKAKPKPYLIELGEKVFVEVCSVKTRVSKVYPLYIDTILYSYRCR